MDDEEASHQVQTEEHRAPSVTNSLPPFPSLITLFRAPRLCVAVSVTRREWTTKKRATRYRRRNTGLPQSLTPSLPSPPSLRHYLVQSTKTLCGGVCDQARVDDEEASHQVQTEEHRAPSVTNSLPPFPSLITLFRAPRLCVAVSVTRREWMTKKRATRYRRRNIGLTQSLIRSLPPFPSLPASLPCSEHQDSVWRCL